MVVNGWPARLLYVAEGIAFPRTQRGLLFALLCSGDAVIFECHRCLPAALSIVVRHGRFPLGVVAAAAASLVTEFPPLFFAQGVVAGVYSQC